MEFHALSDEQRQSFDANGFLIVPGVIDPESLDRMTNAADQYVASRYTESGRHRASLTNVVAESGDLLALMTWPVTLSLIVQLLSFNIRLTKSHLIYKYPDPPDTEEPTFWHRDIANSTDDIGYIGSRMEIKVAFHFSDCVVPGSGTTVVAPGSNLLHERLPLVPGTHDPPITLEPELRAGDALLFENRTYHRQSANRTSKVRKVFMVGYSYAWLAPNDYVEQSPDFLARISDPIAGQLLGARRKSNSQIDGSPLREWAEMHGVKRASEIARSPAISQHE